MQDGHAELAWHVRVEKPDIDKTCKTLMPNVMISGRSAAGDRIKR